MKTEKMRLTYLPLLALALLVLTVLCRGIGYIYSTMATDIAYSDLAVSIMGILVEALTILRTMTGYCAILYAMYRWENNSPVRYRCGGAVTLTVLLCDGLDCFSRYLVDSATSSITDVEILAALWLLLQFCYSTILVMLCWCTGRILFHPAAGKQPCSMDRVLTQCTLYLLGTRLALEIYYLADFLATYSDITPSEISSITGQFLYTIVLYGGAAWGIGMGLSALLKHIYGVPAVRLPDPAGQTAETGTGPASGTDTL
ncbi:MAG: hypothetical protein IJ480_05840 [Clostridia bacterium]|nr:hypothetical protein [Clostridia bacterium]